MQITRNREETQITGRLVATETWSVTVTNAVKDGSYDPIASFVSLSPCSDGSATGYLSRGVKQ